MKPDIPSSFVEIIEDFSAFLSNRQKSGNTFLPVSQTSIKLMENWSMKPAAMGEPVQKRDFRSIGPSDARIFIIDSEGSFFEGGRGGLLVKILGAMNLGQEDVFICGPENSRMVHKKIMEISPRVIITLGRRAAGSLLNMTQPLDNFRGKFHEYCGIKVMPTFHPSLLLKQPEYKRAVWEDMKQVMAYAGL